MLSKASGGLCPPNPLGFFALGLLRQGPALGRWAARRRPHLPFARLHLRSSCVPAELYPPLQHRHLGVSISLSITRSRVPKCRRPKTLDSWASVSHCAIQCAI